MWRSRGCSAANNVADKALLVFFAVVLGAAAVSAQMDFDKDGRLLHEPPLPKEPDLRPLCERGNHQTMGGVTRAGGDGSCRRPGLAQRPTDPNDYMGLVIAPLLEMEFFSMPEPSQDPHPRGGWETSKHALMDGGPWGRHPRQIHRNSHNHFDALGVPDASHIEDVLDELEHHKGVGVTGGGLGAHGSRVRVMRRRKGRVASPYSHGQRVEPEALMHHHRADKHTISILAADERFDGLAQFATGLENNLAMPVTVDYHVTPEKSEHRHPARSHCDTFVLHLGHGPIIWQLWDPPTVFPHPSMTRGLDVGDDNAPRPPEETAFGRDIPHTIRSGDTLYIPPGWVSYPTTNVTFLGMDAAYLSVSLDGSIATWEAGVHAVSRIAAGASTSLQASLTAAAASGGGGACDVVTMLDIVRWAIRGEASRRGELRGRVLLGEMGRHALYDTRDQLVKSAALVHGAASIDGALEAMSNHTQGETDQLLRYALEKGKCDNPLSVLRGDGGEALIQRAEDLLEGALEDLLKAAEEHAGLALDQVLEWSISAVKSRQVARAEGLAANSGGLAAAKEDL